MIAPTLPDPKPFKVLSIKLKRLDGRRDETKKPVLALSWDSADEAIMKMALTAPLGSFHEVQFTIKWADGITYEGSIEMSYDSSRNFELARRVRYHIEVIGGLRKPVHLSETDYTIALAQVPAAVRAHWGKFATTHDMRASSAVEKTSEYTADEVLGWLKGYQPPSKTVEVPGTTREKAGK